MFGTVGFCIAICHLNLVISFLWNLDNRSVGTRSRQIFSSPVVLPQWTQIDVEDVDFQPEIALSVCVSVL
jgi:hypothetical protein